MPDVNIGSHALLSDMSMSESNVSLETGYHENTTMEDESTGEESYNEEIANADEWVPDIDSSENGLSEEDAEAHNEEQGDRNEGWRDPDDPASPTYNLHPRRERDYTYRFDFLTLEGDDDNDGPAGVESPAFHYTNHLVSTTIEEDNELDEVMPRVTHHVMVQLSLKQGLKEFGERGKDAMTAELQQIHMKDTFVPKHLQELAPAQCSKALESLLFLEKKRSGKIKG